MRHINTRYFFITDWVNKKKISNDWCPTRKLVADFMTKPLQGSQFRELRDYIMGRVRCIKLEEPIRVASPTRINLEEPVRVASPTRINLYLYPSVCL